MRSSMEGPARSGPGQLERVSFQLAHELHPWALSLLADLNSGNQLLSFPRSWESRVLYLGGAIT